MHNLSPPPQVHVVLYKHVCQSPPYLENYRFLKPAYVHPLYPVKNAVFSDMERYADVVVEVPSGSTDATVRPVDAISRRRPPSWLPYWSAKRDTSA